MANFNWPKRVFGNKIEVFKPPWTIAKITNGSYIENNYCTQKFCSIMEQKFSWLRGSVN